MKQRVYVVEVREEDGQWAPCSGNRTIIGHVSVDEAREAARGHHAYLQHRFPVRVMPYQLGSKYGASFGTTPKPLLVLKALESGGEK